MNPNQPIKNNFYRVSLPLLIVLIGWAIYHPALRAPFYFDDIFIVVENPIIKNFKNIQWLWYFDPSRFLSHLTFALNYHFGRLDVQGYHLFNIVTHFFNAFLFYLFLRLTLLKTIKSETLPQGQIYKIIVFAVLIFLCHPIQTQAVTYVAQRSTLLAAFFYLSTMVCYGYYRFSNKLQYYFLAIFLAFLGLFTKPIIVTLPAALILYEIYFIDFSWKKIPKLLLRLTPFIVFAGTIPFLLMLWRHKMLDVHRFYDIMQETTQISRQEYLLTQINVFMTYLRLLILPIHQNLDYDYPLAKTFFSFLTYLSFGVLAGILIVAMRIYRRERIISFCIFWFFITLSLETSIFPIADVINEHRLYLPMIGFSLLVPFGFSKMFKRPALYNVIMFVIVVIFAGLTFKRNQIWNNEELFLQDIVQKSPHKARAHNNLANYYLGRNDLLKAEKEYWMAIDGDHNFVLAYNNLGSTYFEQKKFKEAIDVLQKALNIDPRYAEAYYNLGTVYWTMGDLEKAKWHFEKSLEIKPYFAKAMVALGNYYKVTKNDHRLAKKNYLKAIYFNPDLPIAYSSLGDVFVSESKPMMAIEQYLKALECNPRMASAYNNIGNIYDFHDLCDLAISEYKKAVVADPTYANAYYNLANTLRKVGYSEFAKRMLRYAIKLYIQQDNQKMLLVAQRKLDEWNDPEQAIKSR